MRKLVYTSGAFSTSTLGLSVLFKLLHLQGANMLLVSGLLTLTLIFIPSASWYLYQNRKNSKS